MNKWYSHISTERDQLPSRQFVSLLPRLYYPCLAISQICGLQWKADDFAIIIPRPLFHATIFVFFSLHCQIPIVQGRERRHWQGHYSETGLKRTSLSGKQKEIPSPPIVFSPRPRLAVRGSEWNQEPAVCYQAGYHFWNKLTLSLYLLTRSISARSLLLRSKFRLFSKMSSIWSGQRNRVLFNLISSSAKHIQSAPGHCSA